MSTLLQIYLFWGRGAMGASPIRARLIEFQGLICIKMKYPDKRQKIIFVLLDLFFSHEYGVEEIHLTNLRKKRISTYLL